ncbi:hypothetical protein ACFO26_04460 [Lactococcus nasutitermitis]|uniref:DUF4064 domain-containing protein n=1 Tax=Lactococcus nasutitermitis TaxID=1652957 RepID=A0ABV9JBI6_9LACT|nr:hypothetical protein [Lactococcus nasutitermitis]
MSRAKIAALVGCILYTLVIVLGFVMVVGILLSQHSSEFKSLLSRYQLTTNEVITAFCIAYVIIFVILLLSWIAFARLNKERGWRIYLLVLGIVYGLASMVNGAGLLVTLPVAVCFILSFVFSLQEKRKKDI